MKPVLVFAAILALPAAALAQEHHGEHGEHHTHAGPASVVAFHDVLAPDWHSEAGPARMKATCGHIKLYRERAGAVAAEAAPAGVDASEWQFATAALKASVTSLATGCQIGDLAAFDTDLGQVHNLFHELAELVE